MSNIIGTGTEPTAPSTAGTKVETSTSKQKEAIQLADAKVEKQFGEEALAKRNSIRDIVNKLGKSENQLVLDTCSIGYILVETYKGFSVELKKHFWNIVDTSIRSKKTLERAIELVIEKGIKLSVAMDTNGGELDIVENEKLLVIDTRVLKLYEDNLAKVNKPTINKVRNMKGLSKSAWDLVCNGSDKPYNEYMAKKSIEEKEAKEKELLTKKPKTMSEDTFISYTKAAPIVLINEIADNEVEIVSLKEKIALLEKALDKMPSGDRRYTTSAETKSEKA